jgi:hypothetical protein
MTFRDPFKAPYGKTMIRMQHTEKKTDATPYIQEGLRTSFTRKGCSCMDHRIDTIKVLGDVIFGQVVD